MYKRIVQSKVNEIFEQINQGNYEPMLDGLAADFTYTFHGNHALSGVRTTRESVGAWWERVFRVLPGHQFDVLEVLVDGRPWNTRVATRVRISGDLPGGERYENTMFQFLTLKWGRITSMESIEDAQKLLAALEKTSRAGIAEASLPPISDKREISPGAHLECGLSGRLRG